MSSAFSPRAVAFGAVARLMGHPEGGPIDPSAWKRVLWVRLDHVGDVVMSLPMLHSLREAWPEIEIDCLVRPSVAPVLKASGIRVNILTYDSPRFPENRSRFGRGDGFFRTMALVRRLRARLYDGGFELRGDEVGRVLLYLAGAPVRIGIDRQFYEAPGAPNGAVLLTHPVEFPAGLRHQVRNNFLLLGKLDVPENAEFRFPVEAEALHRIDLKLNRLGLERPPVIFHACSNDPARNWTDEGWRRLAATAGELGYPVVFTGLARDGAIIRGILSEIGPEVMALDASGVFTLEELPALFTRSHAMVTVDTGPMHLAAFSGLRLLALMRADLAPRHAPFGQEDRVIAAPEGAPVSEINPEEVDSRFRALVRESESQSI